MLREILQPQLALPPDTTRPIDTSHGIIVYGAGEGGRKFLDWAHQKRVPVRFLVDDAPGRAGQELAGVPIKSSAALLGHEAVPVVIALANFPPVVSRLRTLGIHRFRFSDDFDVHFDSPARTPWADHFSRPLLDSAWHQVERLYQLLADDTSRNTLAGLLKYRLTGSLGELLLSDFPQYLHPLVHPAPGDTVIDAGAWEGDTANTFAQAVGNTGRVFPFEPMPGTFQKLSANAQAAGLQNIITPVNAGLGNADTTARFSTTSADSTGFHVSATGDITVAIRSLDAWCRETRTVPTFLKMDIEGSELAAIRGAAATIRTHKPKLAICVYHKAADLWEIPLALHALNPHYRFHLGQHARCPTETVIYAIHGT